MANYHLPSKQGGREMASVGLYIQRELIKYNRETKPWLLGKMVLQMRAVLLQEAISGTKGSSSDRAKIGLVGHLCAAAVDATKAGTSFKNPEAILSPPGQSQATRTSSSYKERTRAKWVILDEKSLAKAVHSPQCDEKRPTKLACYPKWDIDLAPSEDQVTDKRLQTCREFLDSAKSKNFNEIANQADCFRESWSSSLSAEERLALASVFYLMTEVDYHHLRWVRWRLFLGEYCQMKADAISRRRLGSLSLTVLPSFVSRWDS